MDDKALADKIVALEVGHLAQVPGGYYLDRNFIGMADRFVRDWRVAGACLEQWPTTINTEHLQLTLDQMLRCPVAICEAFVEAMTPSTGGASE